MNISFPQIENVAKFANKAKEHYKNPDLFFQVATGCLAALQLGLQNAPQVFSKFVSPRLLSTLGSPNFFCLYGLFIIPRNLFYPIDSKIIDKQKLIEELKKQINIAHITTPGRRDEFINENSNDSAIRRQATAISEGQKEFFEKKKILPLFEEVIDQQLLIIEKNKKAYRNVDIVRHLIKTTIKEELEKENSEFNITFDLENNTYQFVNKTTHESFNLKVDFLDELEIPLHSTPTLGETLTNIGFGLVDTELSVFALKGWKIIDTAPWAAKIGRYPGLKWVETTGLESVFRVTLVGTFAIKFYEACCQRYNNSSKLNQQIQKEEIKLEGLNQSLALTMHELVVFDEPQVNLVNEEQIYYLDFYLSVLKKQIREKEIKLAAVNLSKNTRKQEFIDSLNQEINALKANQTKSSALLSKIKVLEKSVATSDVEQIKNLDKLFLLENQIKKTEKKLSDLKNYSAQIWWDIGTSALDLTSNAIGLLHHINYIQASPNLMVISVLAARTLNAFRILAGH